MYATVMTLPAHLVYMNIPAKELRTFVDGLFPSLAKNQIADATSGYWHRYNYGHDLLVDVPRTLSSHGLGESMKHFGHVVLTDFPTKAGIPIPGFSQSGFGPLLEQAGIHRGWLNVSLFDGGVGILCVAEGSSDLAQAIAGNLGMNWGSFFDTYAEGGIEIGFAMATHNPILLFAGIQNALAGIVATWKELTTYVDPLDFFGAGGVSTLIGFTLAYGLMDEDLSEASKDAIRSGTIGALFTVSSAFGFGALAGFAAYRLGGGLANKHNEMLSTSLSINENTYRLLVEEICKGNIPVRELLENASPQLKHLDNATLLGTRGETFTDNSATLSTNHTTLRNEPLFMKSNVNQSIAKFNTLPNDPPVFTELYRAAMPSHKERPVWESFKAECGLCTRCMSDGLLDPKAFPVLMKNPPKATDILFVLEAPNRDDTYNPRKGYLTVEPDTDPSGRFFHDLFVNELGFPIQDLFVTNSVLCLPLMKNGKYPVTSFQQSNCKNILQRMIDVFNPSIICPVGAKALLATCRLEKHGYRKMATAVAQPISWYGRILFPLYHTSGQARNPRNGRPEHMQRADWRNLRALWQDSTSS